MANHLREDWFARRVLVDGTQDVLVEIRVRMDTEILRDVSIRATSKRLDDAHERQVGDVLHRSE